MKKGVIFGCNKGHGSLLRDLWLENGSFEKVIGVNRTSSDFCHTNYEEVVISDADYTLSKSLNSQISAHVNEITSVHISIGTIILKPFITHTDQDWEKIMRTNFYIPKTCIEATLPLMKKSAECSFTALSTVASALGMNFHASVASSKSALEGLFKSLAAEYAPIRFNLISSSIFKSPCSETNTTLFHSEENATKSKKRHPLNNFGTMEQIAKICDFLSSDGAQYITGTKINNDGGLSNAFVL